MNCNAKIAIIGNLAGYGYTVLKHLRKVGIDAHLYLFGRDQITMESPLWEDQSMERTGLPNWIHVVQVVPAARSNMLQSALFKLQIRIQFIRLTLELLRYDLVHSFTGSLNFSNFSFVVYSILGLRPYIGHATGSDLREATHEHSLYGFKMRRHFQSASVVISGFDEINLQRFRELRLSQVRFLPQLIDTGKYRPQASSVPRPPFDLVFFHASNLDWSYKGADRSSTKGNDRFIRAFARFVKEGYHALAIILYRGPDKEKTKELVRELGITENVQFLPEMRKDELVQHYNLADVVVDQLDVGSFGTTALEAMSCAKPVMIYINTKASDLIYPDRPPVLNCHAEDEIYEQLIKASNKEYREAMGKQAREWIMKYHHWEKVIRQLIFHYETVLGRVLLKP